MNEIVEQIQESYRAERIRVSYCVFDIGAYLNDLAEKGLIWVLKDQKNISNPEKILIEHYLNEYRANQIYDNLEEFLNIQSPKELSTTPSKEKQTKKKEHLEVRDLQHYVGYNKAKELEEKIIEVCKTFPSFEIDHIVNQIERSAGSIKERIEMGEQIYVGEKYNQYSIAIGSAKETTSWLQISLGQKYITQFQFDELDNLTTQVVSILTTRLSNIREKEGKGLDLPSPYTANVKNFGAYNNALLLVKEIYGITNRREFWKEKNLVKKMRKRATSCVANIAEAHQLYTPRQFRFFNDSLKALRGLESSLDTSLSKGIISKVALQEIYELMNSIRNVLTHRMKNISDEKAS